MADDQPHILEPACNAETLFAPGLSQDQTCELARSLCESASMLNFNELYFCTFETSNTLFYPVGIIALSIAFYLLSFIADDFLSPSLQQISKTFKISESLAGVTLLAFGGGAPDVFASLSAAQGGETEGIEMAIAVLLGSSLFILSVIASGVMHWSPQSIHMKKQFFIRDTSFLFIGVSLLLYAITIRGCIDTIMSVAFIILYVTYVIVVFLLDRANEQEENSELSKKAARAAQMTELDGIRSFGENPAESAKAGSYDFENQFKQDSTAYYYINKNTSGPSLDQAANDQTESFLLTNRGASPSGSLSQFMKEDYIQRSTEDDSLNSGAGESNEDCNSNGSDNGKKKKKKNVSDMFILRNLKVTVKRENLKRPKLNSKEEKQALRIQRKDPAERRKQALLNCFHTVIEGPVRFMCKMSIPCSEREKWNNNFAAANPLCCVILFLVASDKLDFMDFYQQMILLASVVMGVTIRFLTQKTTPPRMRIFMFYQLGSFAFSMLWIYVLCEVIVDLLELFGVVTGLPASFLGLTVLSWGNSLGDAIASVSISKRGFGEMAITGCVAGPIFNLMLGFGLTTLLCNLQSESGKIIFDTTTSEGVSSFAALMATMIVLVTLIWMTFANDFKLQQKHASILLIIYLVAIVFIAYASMC